MRALGGLVPVVAVLAGLAVGVAQIPGFVGDKVNDALAALNPFRDEGANRTGPAVLQRLTALSEFKAARGYYEVVVEFEDPNNLPDFLSGNSVIYIGKGDVEALVDFSELDERRVSRSRDGKSVTVNLPAPTISEPRLDLRTSRVAGRDEGFLKKFEGSDIEQRAQIEAVDRLASAANGNGQLTDLAEENTRAMLRGLFGSLGYTNITITFDESPADGT